MLRKAAYRMDKMVRLSLVLSLLPILLGHQAVLVSARSTAKYTPESEIKYLSNRIKSESAKESALDNLEKTPQSKIPCINGGSESEGTLTEVSLKYLINSVFHIFNEAPVNKFYGTVDYGEKLAENSDPVKLFWSGSGNLDVSGTYPLKIWLNYPPFVNSSHYLISSYQDRTEKPTLEILGMFSVEEVSETIEQFKCLAKLKHLGFNLVPWNIQDFRDNMDQQHCKNLLDQAVNTNGFTEQHEIVEKLLDHVNEMSQNPNIATWCPVATTMLAKLQSMN